MSRTLIFIIVLFSAVLFCIEGNSFGDELYYDPYVNFQEASVLYAESQFKDAVKLYEEILKHDYESASLYYNLGNAYFKLGFLGSAILNYERARRLMPYDSDLRSNLSYASSLRQQAQMEGNRLWFNRRIGSFLSAFTTNGLTLTLSAIYLMVILLLGLIIFKRSVRKIILRFVVTFSVIFMLVLTLMAIKVYTTEHICSAVVLTDETDAGFEPLTDTALHFRLYAGSKIIVLKVRDQWSQIKREDGKIGWIKSDTYGII